MNQFETDLRQRLSSLQEQGLYRQLRRVESPQSSRVKMDGQVLLNFSSNDYLGLANHQALKDAAIEAVERYGAGAGASRLICGSMDPHQELDEALAVFKSAPTALSFTTGYAAAQGTIGALLGPDDILILDKLVHACFVDAARLCKATVRVCRHNDLNHLEQLLKWADKQRGGLGTSAKKRVLFVTESVFSMDGDHAPLPEIVPLKEKHGAWLMLDEAHSTGLYGPNRRGLAEQWGLGHRVEIQMGTLGKAIGAAGGFVCGSKKLTELLINRARSFIFSTAPVPAAAAAARAGIRLIESSPGAERCKRLWELVGALPKSLAKGEPLPSAIVPIHLGNESKAVDAAARLRDRGVFVPAIRYPTVARGRARLRLTLTADHTMADLNQLEDALAKATKPSR